MGISVSGTNGKSCQFNNRGWLYILHTAEDYGWEPQGIVHANNWPDHEITCPVYKHQDMWAGCNCTQAFGGERHYDYSGNDMKMVLPDDAKSFATALQKFLQDLASFEQAVDTAYNERERSVFVEKARDILSDLIRSESHSEVYISQLNELSAPIQPHYEVRDDLTIAMLIRAYLIRTGTPDWVERIEELVRMAESGDLIIH